MAQGKLDRARLDMGRAWTQASALMAGNRETISAVAGLFFFLPSFAVALFVPALGNPAPAAPAGADPSAAMDAMMAQMSQAYADNWLVLLLIGLVQFVGSLCLLALLTDRRRPTVGEALSGGMRSLPSYLAAQLLSGLAIALAAFVPIAVLGATGSAVAAAAGVFLALLLAIYMFIKFSLIAPVVVIDGVRNPVAALRRSWRLTKGNSLRIAVFMALLFVTIFIIAALVAGVLGLIFAAFGSHIAMIGNGVVSAAINAVISVVFLVVIAAIHRQLAGASPERLAETFE